MEKSSRFVTALNVKSRDDLDFMNLLSPSLRLGLVGLSLTVTLNLLALAILDQPAAEFFSTRWWATWFTSYTVWAIFLLVGLAKKRGSANLKAD